MSGEYDLPCDILARHLQSLGLGTDPEDDDTWPLFASHMPTEPDEAIAVYDTVGFTQGRIQRTGDTVDKLGISVKVRGNDPVATYKKCNKILQSFDRDCKQKLVTIGDYTYRIHAVSRKTAVIPDRGKPKEETRSIYFVNALMTMTVESEPEE